MQPFFIFPLLIVLFHFAPAFSDPRSEIDSLLNFVGRQNGAVFLRNGSTHTAPEAEAHLRMKWKRLGSRVKTAEDFIAQCATRSYLTGNIYRIRYPDGRLRNSEAVLREELQRIRLEQQPVIREKSGSNELRNPSGAK